MKKWFLALLLVSPSLLAWDGVNRGKVSFVDVTHGQNYDLRISVVGAANTMCGAGGVGWAYINATDSNYQSYLSVLLAARLSGLEVTVYAAKDASGFCKIGYISM